MASRGFREREWKRTGSGELSLLFPIVVDGALLQKLMVERTERDSIQDRNFPLLGGQAGRHGMTVPLENGK